jgi:hypothetical protein
MRRLLLVAVLLSGPVAVAQEQGEFVPLFNGRDLSGWVNVNCAPGTFTVRDGVVVSTGKPTGVMRTERQYENFVLELEWKHLVPKGNAGLFVWSYPLTAPGTPFARSIEVQILDGRNSETYTSHGDVFAIHGATMTPDRPHPAGAMRCLPSEHRCKPAGQWNHYRVECRDGVIQLAVNGKVVSGGSKCSPRKGYVCLESEGSECHFRNIRIQELPSTNPTPEETAPVADGFRPLYTGLDLSGWKTDGEQSAWQPSDWRLVCTGKNATPLATDREFGDLELVVDVRPTSDLTALPVRLRGYSLPLPPDFRLSKGRWHRVRAKLVGDRLTLSVGDQKLHDGAKLNGLPPQGPIALHPADGRVEFASVLVRELPEP